MFEFVLGVGIIMVIAVIALVVYLRFKQISIAYPSGKSLPIDPREEVIDRSARTLKQIFLHLADTIGRLDGATDNSATALLDTREKVDAIQVDDSLRSAQDSLLTAIDGLLEQNTKLREELRGARTDLATQQKEINKLETAVRVDPLTQVGNRKSFDERLVEAFHHFRRYQESFCLLMVDVDHFKQINDTYGHLNGDRVLAGVAKKLRASVRGSDFIARYGGEEFGILLPKTESSIGLDIAEKVREGIEFSQFNLDGTPVRVTVSAGVAESMAEDTTDSLVSRTDEALYEAKRAGRNRAVIARANEAGKNH